jgi:hypothetical protein
LSPSSRRRAVERRVSPLCLYFRGSAAVDGHFSQ